MLLGLGWQFFLQVLMVDLQEVSLRDKPQSMLDIFSKGIVPVLFVTNLRKSLKETFCRFVCRCFSFTKKYSNERRHHKKCTYNYC